jgi:hypothetical protein
MCARAEGEGEGAARCFAIIYVCVQLAGCYVFSWCEREVSGCISCLSTSEDDEVVVFVLPCCLDYFVDTLAFTQQDVCWLFTIIITSFTSCVIIYTAGFPYCSIDITTVQLDRLIHKVVVVCKNCFASFPTRPFPNVSNHY